MWVLFIVYVCALIQAFGLLPHDIREPLVQKLVICLERSLIIHRDFLSRRFTNQTLAITTISNYHPTCLTVIRSI